MSGKFRYLRGLMGSSSSTCFRDLRSLRVLSGLIDLTSFSSGRDLRKWSTTLLRL